MAAEESVDRMETELDQKGAEFNGKCDNYQPDVVMDKAENAQDSTETGLAASSIESQEQSFGVVVPNDSEARSSDREVVNGRGSPASAEEGNTTQDAVIKVEPASDVFLSLAHQENNADSELVGDTSTALVHDENESGAGSASASPIADPSDLMKRNQSLERLCDVLMDERDRATSERKEKDDEVLRLRTRSFESEQEKGHLKSQLAKALGRAVLAEKEMVSAKEENAELRAEIERLTKRIEELEAENSDWKCQLEKARGNRGYAEENKTAVDSESVTLSRVDELQEGPYSVATPSVNELQESPDYVANQSVNELQESPDSVAIPSVNELQESPDSVANQSVNELQEIPDSVANQSVNELQESPDSVANQSVNELQESPDSVANQSVNELQENPHSVAIPSVGGGDECKQENEPNRAKAASTGHTIESEEVTRRRERAAKRASPNFYRHSFAGSLPRPFHSVELPRQTSHDDHHERSGSFHSDTSGESGDSESGGHLVSNIPSFMRKADKPPFLKSGFSPVQFNYQPLPDSIMHSRREGWDALRHGSMMRARGDSLNRARSISLDAEISEVDGGSTHHEPLERLSREQHANEFNSAQGDVHSSEENGKPKDDIETETEKCGVTVQISSISSPDVARHAENTPNSDSKDSVSVPTAQEPRESHANVPLHGDENVPSNDRSEVPDDEEEKRETVSELVNIWTRRTTEVYDV